MQKQYQNQQVKVKESHTRTIIFVSLIGDVLMILENINKVIIWSSILDKIANEAWFLTCEKWRFVLGIKNLEIDDVLDFTSDVINIICIKVIVPKVIFKLQSGELLVSIPFEDCKTFYEKQVNVSSACFGAHQKLKELGKDGYGTKRTKKQPLFDTYTCFGRETSNGEECSLYILRDKNGKSLFGSDVLENPGDENLIIVVVPEQIYCNHCYGTNFHGPLHEGEKRIVIRGIIRVIGEIITLCPDCGFLHCPSCGMYRNHKVRTSECRTSCHMYHM